MKSPTIGSVLVGMVLSGAFVAAYAPGRGLTNWGALAVLGAGTALIAGLLIAARATLPLVERWRFDVLARRARRH